MAGRVLRIGVADEGVELLGHDLPLRYRKMVQNVACATGCNALAIPMAAGLFAPWEIILPMSVDALVMSLSTAVVALNARLLRRMRLRCAPVS